jgi:hypothetical protein
MLAGDPLARFAQRRAERSSSARDHWLQPIPQASGPKRSRQTACSAEPGHQADRW